MVKDAEFDLPIVTKDDNTDVVSLEVKGHTLDSGLELNHLTGLDLGESENSGDTITNGDDGSEFLKVILHERKQLETRNREWTEAWLAWARVVANKK